ncbi:hypothetical protein MMC10_006382 [Thelotrema lepadinum]|nr:hypothetical protein [Thelotrema lepadinum]
MKRSGQSLFKALANKIHPPLPMTPRDSQKLLGLLNESFRQQLQSEHTKDTPGSSNPTNAHVQSVLSSPLFRSQPKNTNIRPRDKRIPGKYVAEVQELLLAPMQYFQEQVAAGQATLDLARRCLEIQQKNKTLYKNSISPNAQGDSVHPILHWLWASGMEESMEFIHHPEFLHRLVPSMIAENRDDQLWKWVWRLETASATHSQDSELSSLAPHSANSAELLTRFVRAVFVVRSSIEDAINVFIKASRDFERSFPSQVMAALERPVIELSYLLLRAKPSSISNPLYENLLRIVRRYQIANTGTAARLSLCHPSKPDCSMALSMIRRGDIPEQPTKRCKSHFTLMCLRTNDMLVAAGRKKEATEVMNVLWRITDTVATEAAKHVAERTEEDLEHQIEHIRPMLA